MRPAPPLRRPQPHCGSCRGGRRTPTPGRRAAPHATARAAHALALPHVFWHCQVIIYAHKEYAWSSCPSNGRS
nr:hypothetical protein RVX_2612 [Nitratidesulfovibrio sp. HK-II]